MILPVAASLLLLTQAPAATPPRADSAAGVSSLPVAPAPGLPRVLVSGVPAVPADFEAWLVPYTEVRSALLADAGDDGKAVLILTRFSSVNQIHEGARESLYMTIVGSRVVLVVIFDTRTSLGLVRLRVKKASDELGKIFEALVKKTESPGGMGSPFAEISDEDIDNLFSE